MTQGLAVDAFTRLRATMYLSPESDGNQVGQKHSTGPYREEHGPRDISALIFATTTDCFGIRIPGYQPALCVGSGSHLHIPVQMVTPSHLRSLLNLAQHTTL
jgi:hypothetical protein